VAAERLEERLKAAVDGAAQDPAIDLDLGHARRAPTKRTSTRCADSSFAIGSSQ
jgi:hypothetical protein